MVHKHIGDRAFYSRVLAIMVPIAIQNGITTFVSLLDNIMVGQIGTHQMSGVSVVNQLLFVFTMCVFGATAGAGIFTAQFHGADDERGIRSTMQFKLLACLLITGVAVAILLLAGPFLIGLYLQGEGSAADAEATLHYGMEYLTVMLHGLLPFALSNAYATTLRECGHARPPMVAGIVAVLVNLGLNAVLIFGLLGFPAMGAKGAALATVISRYAELAVIVGWAHLHTSLLPFLRGLFRRISIPFHLLKAITSKSLPLLLNEVLWAGGLAILNQCYSYCGLEVVPAQNISGVLYNLGCVIFLALANAVGIIMGQMLGANRPKDELHSTNRKLILLSLAIAAGCCAIMAAISEVFPMIYNTTDSVRDLAGQMIRISIIGVMLRSYMAPVYFTLRSGGQALVTFVYDSGTMWVVTIPMAFLLSRYTGISVQLLYALCLSMDLFKCIFGAYLLRKGVWIRNLTGKTAE